MEDKRSVYKGLILYPENEEHIKAFDIIQKNYIYKAIIHDRDVDKNGEIKKPHMHIIVKLDSTQFNKTFAENIGVSSNYVQVIHSVKGAYDYLTHRFSPDKYQYDNSELLGDLDLSFDENISGEFQCIIQAIKKLRIKNMLELTEFCIENNYLTTLRKNSYLFSQILHYK